MSLEAVIYVVKGSPRSRIVCDAFHVGLRKMGVRVRYKTDTDYIGAEAPVAFFYGLAGNCKHILRDYKASGLKAIYVDLGYWLRETRTNKYLYHKLSINSRHPTEYFQKVNMPLDRFKTFGVRIEPWRTNNKHILLAGMGDKAANAAKLETEAWEYAAVAEIRKYTDRPIIYRPKPSWKGAKEIPGTIYSPKTQPLAEVLTDCHAVVTHHSNVAVDGILRGVPAFCWEGVAVPMSLQDLSLIENPLMPKGRMQWAANIAYTQWCPSEMKSGLPWKHFKNQGLL